MVTTESFAAWLEMYLRPQERGDAEGIKEIFAEDGIYWWGPFNEPRHGVRAIYEHHKNALARQRENKYEYRILATTKDYGIAKFSLTLRRIHTNESMEYEGIFLVYLDESGTCTLFQEWVNSRVVAG